MLENRSFDHMLGFLKQTYNTELDGLNGNETNPYNPQNPNSPVAKVDNNAPYVDPNPGHEIVDATQQIFGGPENPNIKVAPMNGFVANAESIAKGWGIKIMQCFNESAVPAISTLAKEFAVFDRWYSSVPGPTEVNRFYVHSATSHGLGFNDPVALAEGLPQKPIYMALQEVGASWKIYFEEATTTLFLSQLRNPAYFENFGMFDDFLADAEFGQLPNYAFVEPRYFDFLEYPANDQHPSHDVGQGDLLIKKVYEALRRSPQWNETLLIITYDEHGGFFDHSPTPLKDIPNPDGLSSTKPPFNFTRLGIRIPVVMVSPWINKGTIVHEPSNAHYEHSSIPATLKKMFSTKDFLTARDAWAATFESVFMERDSPRTDCPTKLPSPPHLGFSTDSSLTDLQESYLALASAINGGVDEWQDIKTEFAGALFMRNQMSKYFKKTIG